MFYPPLNAQKKTLLESIIKEVTALSREIIMIFHINEEQRFRSSRHTYPFYPEFELLVILPNERFADIFYGQWMEELVNGREDMYTLFNRANLQIISEREFIEELDSLAGYSERVLKSRIVYDKEVHLYN